MLTFFTDPYEGELLYSVIARYHFYIGNRDEKDTIEEMFGTRTITPIFGFGSNIDYLSSRLSGRYTSELIINKYTLYPFYSIFFTQKRKEKIKQSMMKNGGMKLYAESGIPPGDICSKKEIYYCPICSKRDIEEYGESYIRRIHQVPGVIICPDDKAILKKYSVQVSKISQTRYLRIENDKLDFDIEYEKDKDLEEKLLRISQSVKYILDNPQDEFNKEKSLNRYKYFLVNKNLITVNNQVKQRKLCVELKKYYGEKLLKLLESEVNEDYKGSWLRLATTSEKKTVHPLRHILLINFLVDDIEKVFDSEDTYLPFEKSSWICLNQISDHYGKQTINTVELKAECNTRELIGVFKCTICGFTYTRLKTDEYNKDIYKIRTIVDYGVEWKDTLKKLLEKKEYSKRQLMKIMKCGARPIERFDYEFGTLNFSHKNRNKNSKGRKIEGLEEKYKNVIREMVEHNTRTDMQVKFKKEYDYFFRNDKEWLFNELLKCKKPDPSNKYSYKANWEKRDEKFKENIQLEYEKALKAEKPVRITKTMLCRSLGIATMFNENIEKLPQSNKLISEITETVEEFQKRRIKRVIEKMVKGHEVLTVNQILIRSGINYKFKDKNKEYINDILEDLNCST